MREVCEGSREDQSEVSPFLSFLSIGNREHTCLLQGHHYSIDGHADRDKERDGEDSSERADCARNKCIVGRVRERIKGLKEEKRDREGVCSQETGRVKLC